MNEIKWKKVTDKTPKDTKMFIINTKRGTGTIGVVDNIQNYSVHYYCLYDEKLLDDFFDGNIFDKERFID